MLRIVVLLALVACTSLAGGQSPLFPPENRIPVDQFQLVKPYTRWMSKYHTLGSVITTMSEIRLTSDAKSKSGAIWTRTSLGMDAFTVETRLRISSSSPIVADGMGIWFAERASHGHAYGVSPLFTGFGVVLDIYDNTHARRTPLLALVASNGTTPLDNDNNGEAHTLDSCRVYDSTALIREGRDHNARESIAVHVEYMPGKLAIFFKQERDLEWQHCLTHENVYIPRYFYLGVSASTGDLSAQQDLLSLKVFDVPIDLTVKARNTMHFEQAGTGDGGVASKTRTDGSKIFSVLFFTAAFIVVLGAVLIIIKPDLLALLPGTQASIDKQKRFY